MSPSSTPRVVDFFYHFFFHTMSILSERVSPNLNLRMQGIETREAVTFRDVIIAIHDNRTRHP